jgi:hypothetical protein
MFFGAFIFAYKTKGTETKINSRFQQVNSRRCRGMSPKKNNEEFGFWSMAMRASFRGQARTAASGKSRKKLASD